MNRLSTLTKQLDLTPFIENLREFFAREKEITLDGDKNILFSYIQALESTPFTPPPSIKNLDNSLASLKKFGTLKLEEIFEFVKILRYFGYLKRLMQTPSPLTAYLDKIIIPEPLLATQGIFAQEGEIKQGVFEALDSLKASLKRQNQNMQESLNKILRSSALAPYLVDSQIHFINQTQTLLLKAGYQNAIKGVVLQRSQNGFFYLLPEEIRAIYQKIQEIENRIEEELYTICKDISSLFQKHFSFLNFLNKEFDKIDHLQARIFFAKAHNLNFILPQHKDSQLILKDFAHPILSNPKPISLDFSKQLLLITGVNAGGKTMLLKSLLSAVFLSKHLIPFKINPHQSKIPHFKNIFAIISDPQNSKNNISTFAGRMLDFSKILQEKDMILGIDEIELGTDADEAASLYKILLENLLDKKAKIIVTTHHKRLAALMANDPRIELVAAIYDEQKQAPTFDFMLGSIGKSYAFETAKRYHIPTALIERAKQNYGEDKEKLNLLIEKSAQLEISLKQKEAKLTEQIQEYQRKQENLKTEREKQKAEFALEKSRLQKTYDEALKILKDDLKNKQAQDIHRAFNNANKILSTRLTEPAPAPKSRILKIGDRVKYKQNKGTILSIQNHKYFIELDEGMRLKVDASTIKPIGKEPTHAHAPKAEKILRPSQGFVHLDLHGLRAEEALEKLDKFISDSLLSGFDEVLVYHGIGGGILARVVREFLSTHPKIVGFEDAPPQMGGMGAKVIKR